MNYSASVEWDGRLTPKVRSVMAMFGLDLERLKEPACHAAELDLRPGEICYITGPSGAGKSLLLRRIFKLTRGRKAFVEDIPLPADATLIDCVPGNVIDSLRVLSKAGLSDAFCVLNQPARLSDGQKWRFRLAMAMAGGATTVFADEFCSTLDRLTAAAIAWNIRKWSRKTGVTFVLGSCHDDLLADLQPDVIVVKHLSGPPDVIRR
jgi:uncharacterized protein